MLLFLLPCEWYIRRHGKERLVYLGLLIIIILGNVRAIQGEIGGSVFFELYIVASMLAALYVIHFSPHAALAKIRGLYRLLLLTIVFGLTTYPIISSHILDPQLAPTIAAVLTDALASQPGISANINMIDVVTNALTIVLSSYIAIFFLMIIGMWVLGEYVLGYSRIFNYRSTGTTDPVPVKRYDSGSFILDRNAIWVLIGTLVLLLASLRFDLAITPISVNVFLVTVFCFIMQGIAVCFFLLGRKFNFYMLSRMLIPTLLVVAIIPVINVIMFGGLVIVGISETWVPYRLLGKDNKGE